MVDDGEERAECVRAGVLAGMHQQWVQVRYSTVG